MKRTAVKPTSPIWVSIVRILLLVLLALVLTNWGYFVKQVSSWFVYDVLNKQSVAVEDVLTGRPDRLAIPDIGLDVPLVYVDATDEITFQHGLEQGVVHYPDTANPGELGNAYYFGHSSDYVFKSGKYKTVFATLPRTEVGAMIYITNHAGKQFAYQVVDKKIVESKDMSVLSQGDGKAKLLTLQTSWPLGTALKRYVVVAEIE
jgi:LPXTG-site transpeptidase (sortase) family protein